MSTKPFTPCVLNSSIRASFIQNASTQVIYCGPGLAEVELQALRDTIKRLPKERVKILVDPSPASFKAGYWGELSPTTLIDLIQDIQGAEIAKGLRLGLLIVDEHAWIYAPTTQSIEPEILSESEPNAVLLNEEASRLLMISITASPDSPVVHRQGITKEALQMIQDELGAENSPHPKQKRLLEEIRPRLNIVQFEVSGYKISLRKIQLPKEIVTIISSNDPKINERINANWKVFQNDADLELEKLQKEIENRLDKIKELYLVRLGHFGFGLLSAQKASFDTAWSEFQDKTVDTYKTAIRERISSMVNDSQTLLLKLLRERAKDGTLNIPLQHVLFPTSREAAMDRYLSRLIKDIHWPTPDEVANNIIIKYRSYDISEQLLEDKEFRRLLESHFGDLDEWFEHLEKAKVTQSPESFSFSMN